MKLNLDEIMVAADVPWNLTFILKGGLECVTRPPTDAELQSLKSGLPIAGEDALTLLSGILNVATDDIRTRDRTEIQAAFSAYVTYYWQREKQIYKKANDVVMAAVTTMAEQEK